MELLTTLAAVVMGSSRWGDATVLACRVAMQALVALCHMGVFKSVLPVYLRTWIVIE